MDINSADRRFLNLAYKLSRRSTHRDHQLGAVVVRGGAVVNHGWNDQKWGRHAEVRAIRPHMDLAGCTIYVVRQNGRCSRPCPVCQECIRRAGIKMMVYYNEHSIPCREAI